MTTIAITTSLGTTRASRLAVVGGGAQRGRASRGSRSASSRSTSSTTTSSSRTPARRPPTTSPAASSRSALLVAAIVFYPRLRAGARATIALLAGFFGVLVGIEAVHYTRAVGPSGDDYTGLLVDSGRTRADRARRS